MKKALVIFDLNKTLFYARKHTRAKTFDTDDFDKLKPNEVIDGTSLYFRQGRNQLLDLLFLQQREFFDVGVWSSLDKDKTSAFAKIYFERYYKNLVFVSATRREEYEGVKSTHSLDPLPVKRDINQLFEKFPTHDLNSTIVVSNFPNLLQNYQMNDLVLKQYDPQLLGAKFIVDYSLFALAKYLSGVKVLTTSKGINDVRQVLMTKSFDDTLARIENHQMGFMVYK
eukprot:CAMPEP_0176417290 /NCGR_PEP_ID=MMETSP0127-20121128/6810_1 /TAXON_ID=938130 /ORGANISM="Platyophrya macrostoma, Strain WH" /LENGTH=225 /DNA_ID=CAMNT_0017797441 /DNA_START=125 /DNA_END=802 /DNA_ORIENTATION=+